MNAQAVITLAFLCFGVALASTPDSGTCASDHTGEQTECNSDGTGLMQSKVLTKLATDVETAGEGDQAHAHNGFDGGHIVAWKVSKTTTPQGNDCGVELDAAKDALAASGGGEWESYSKSGSRNAGCGDNACNGDNGVNLECHYTGKTNGQLKHVNAYAQTCLISDSDKDVTLFMGSDDGLAVFLNGNSAFENLKACRCYGDRQDQTSIHLNQGVNILTFKIGEADGHFGFTAELDNTDGIRAVECADAHTLLVLSGRK